MHSWLRPASTPSASPGTWPASWTATGGGPQQRGLKRTEGHAAGEDALFDAVEGALELGLDHFTVYAFSTENWKRPPDEVRYLMGFNEGILMRHTRRARREGRAHPVPRPPRLAGAAAHPAAHRRGHRADQAQPHDDLQRRFNYGGRAEIVDAVKALVAEGVAESKIDEKAIRRHLYAPELPDPDLVVRTSGEYRISNFLLWELAYSELVFTDVLWPDFRREHLFDAVREYQARERRFGGVRGAVLSRARTASAAWSCARTSSARPTASCR